MAATTHQESEMRLAMRALIEAAQSAVDATAREDDPANLPSEVINEIDAAVFRCENALRLC